MSQSRKYARKVEAIRKLDPTMDDAAIQKNAKRSKIVKCKGKQMILAAEDGTVVARVTIRKGVSTLTNNGKTRETPYAIDVAYVPEVEVGKTEANRMSFKLVETSENWLKNGLKKDIDTTT